MPHPISPSICVGQMAEEGFEPMHIKFDDVISICVAEEVKKTYLVKFLRHPSIVMIVHVEGRNWSEWSESGNMMS